MTIDKQTDRHFAPVERQGTGFWNLFQNLKVFKMKFRFMHDLNFYSLNCVFKMEFRIWKFIKFRKYFKMNLRFRKFFKTCILGLYAYTLYKVECLSQSKVCTWMASIGHRGSVATQNASFENFQILKFILNNFRNLKKFCILNFILKTQFKL